MLNKAARKLDTEYGVWQDWNGARFLIAHMSAIRFQRANARLQQPYRKKIEAGNLDPMILRKITCQAMAEGLILDWADVTDDTGVRLAYTPKECAEWLESDAEFREFVSDFAMTLTNFHQEAVDELGKS